MSTDLPRSPSPAAPSAPDARGPAVPAVSWESVSRSFSGVPVLRRVTLQAYAGRVLALVGENGAGKSTLMNILGGHVPAESGALRLGGLPYAPRTPHDARAAGIAFVHQELNLFANLTVAENLHLHDFPRRAGLPWIDRAAMRARAAALLGQVGLHLAPDTPLDRLSTGERQLVEIARALGTAARVLILDEPTTSLSTRERERLFTLLATLRDRGLALVYISHDLEDVLRLADDVAVLRDGEVVAHGRAADFTGHRLVSLMIGRQVTQLYPARRDPPERASADRPDELGVPRLEVRGVSEPGIVRDITFTLHRGELLGLFGLMGAGRSELARILFGVYSAASGAIRMDGRPLAGGPRARVRRGMAFVTDDRRHDGLCLDASVTDNIMLATLAACCRTPARLVHAERVRATVRRIREAVRLSRAAEERQAVRTLSGGNQQKVVLARWLLAKPQVLILDEPTRGVDVGARAEIYRLVRDLADSGAGILVISSEIEELIGLCDRILVMRQGELSGELARDAFDRARLLAAALPATAAAATGAHS
ncbi:MAG: ATP-binding cassette domain-containing protein [Luteitalea sp.]|nr:ATP-binding cassette domain-containing protein [Luteitalea sp.]